MQLGRFRASAVSCAAAVSGMALIAGAALLAGLVGCAPVPTDRGPAGSAGEHQATQPEGTTMTTPHADSVEPPTSPSPVSAHTDLSITVTPSPGADPVVYRLVMADGVPGAGSTVPDLAAAVSALERFGAGVFFPVPGPPRQCMDVYGGPQVAVVAGVFQGRPVEAVFKRTDSCETARWRALAPLFGAVAGGTGAT